MSRPIRHSWLLLACVLVPTAVAAQDAEKKKEEKKDPNRVTAEEIAGRPEARNAREVIQLLRPAWFRPCRPSTGGSTRESATAPALYVDEVRDRIPLQEIPAADVTEMKFLPGNRALALYGDGHECGAIFVVRHKP